MKTLAIKKTNKQSKTLNLIQRKHHGKLAIQLKNRIEIIHTDDIIYCESDANYTTIHLEGRSKIVLSKTLKLVCTALPRNFIRIHQSYSVNIEKVTAIDHQIELVDEIKLPISRNKRKETLEAICRKVTIF